MEINDLISRTAAKEAIRKKFLNISDRCEINEVLNSMPVVDAVPVNWISAYMNKAHGRVRAEIIREMLDAWMEQKAR